jgi:tetraacyldisaccharide 4'-kinase
MREPGFWWRGDGAVARLLAPAGAAYGFVAARRMAQPGRPAAVPVLCVGNFTVGGSGKTPTAIAVARLLSRCGRRPFFLSRGYGGRLAGPVRVDAQPADMVGDEPLLLARIAPTIVARDRPAGAAAAAQAGADAIVMDDGWQNPSLCKDLAIAVLDGRRGIGNGHIIPAGPLRAPIGMQLDRVQAIIVVGPPNASAAILEGARHRRIAIFHARFEPDRNVIAAIGKRKVLAFAGIGDPEKFFTTLGDAGIDIAVREGFPDHHRYTAADAQGLVARAQAANLMLVTTEKDMMRLAGEPQLEALGSRVSAFPVRLVIEEADQFRQTVMTAVKRS